MGASKAMSVTATEPVTSVEAAVRSRYSDAAREREADLCCPVGYDPQFLEVIPQPILERDYGCGDPSRYAATGETVLDLGSGSGKICYILAQRVGPGGRVIGVDFNDEMLALARQFQDEVAGRLAYSNVEFRKGRVQDLKLDYEKLDAFLKERPVGTSAGLLELEAYADSLRQSSPLISDNSIDLVVSNCVLNLVRDEDKNLLIQEIYRVLRPGGRMAVCDIVCDEDVPDRLKRDPKLWSGCITGAFREDDFLTRLESAGFYGISIDRWEAKPFRTIEGIEFRAVTVLAYKGKEGPCMEHNQAVIYKGPWKKVHDDDGHLLERGRRMAVCAKTFAIYSRPPYRNEFIFLAPYNPVAPEAAQPFDCRGRVYRHPRQTKGMDYQVTEGSADACCGPDGCC